MGPQKNLEAKEIFYTLTRSGVIYFHLKLLNKLKFKDEIADSYLKFCKIAFAYSFYSFWCSYLNL